MRSKIFLAILLLTPLLVLLMHNRAEPAADLRNAETDPVKAHLDELEKMVQDEDGKPLDIDSIDDAAIQAKVKEVEEAMHGVSAKLYEAAAAEMAEQDGSGDDGDINVGGDDVVDADFEVVEDDED